MANLIVLGSSFSIPDLSHENAHLALEGDHALVLIDCASNPLVRLPQAGLDLEKISDIILTHFHPDHVSGLPLLLMDLWLLGRKNTLIIHGLDHTLTRVEKMMDLFDWSTWPGFFPVVFHRIANEEMTPVLEGENWRIFASPVHHLIPNIALRIEFLPSGKAVVYSSDTEPCMEVIQLASEADVLLHEASGESQGHSSAAQAGDVARQAKVKKLLLIHYPTGEHMNGSLVSQAAETFPGAIALAEDFMRLEF